ncbi:MAG TPA: hypothetical protein VNI83_01905 [Vicinamibacterales bacterium]|nr:hypothetical protein [Vicinamibacterales bacterium]
MPNSGAMYREPGNVGALNPSQFWIIPLQTSVGIVSSSVIQNLARNISTL